MLGSGVVRHVITIFKTIMTMNYSCITICDVTKQQYVAYENVSCRSAYRQELPPRTRRKMLGFRAQAGTLIKAGSLKESGRHMSMALSGLWRSRPKVKVIGCNSGHTFVF